MRASPVGRQGWSLIGSLGEMADPPSSAILSIFARRGSREMGGILRGRWGSRQGFLDMGEITANVCDGMSDPRGRRSLRAQREREHGQE